MKLWKNRPLFTVCCVWIMTALVGFFLVTSIKILLLLSALLTTLSLSAVCAVRAWLLRRPFIKHITLLLYILLAISAALTQSYVAMDRKEATAAQYDGQLCEVVGTVTEARGRGGQMTTFVLELSSINGKPVRHKVLLTCYYIADLKPGYTLCMSAEASSLAETAGNIYEEYHFMSDGIFGGLLSKTADDYTILSETPNTLSMAVLRHRTLLSEHMELLFGDEAEGLPSALLLGDRVHLSDALKHDFKRVGVSHMLAISGLHITLLFGFLAALFKLFRLPPRLRAILLSLIAEGYLSYLGFPPSATRAVVMLGMTYLASLCYAGADPLTSLGVAGALILLISPTTVADVGFWMSFSATFGLLTVMPFFKRSNNSAPISHTPLSFFKTQGGRIVGAACSGLAAITASLWITVPVMGEISLLSLPMTLVMTPLIGLLLVLVPLALLTESFFFGAWVVSAVKGTVSAAVAVCQIGDAPWAVVPMRHQLIGIIAVLIIISTLYLLGRSLRKKVILLLPMALGVLLIATLVTLQTKVGEKELQISYLVPSSESELLVMTNGQNTVICEISNGSHSAFFSAAKEAHRQGATEISVLMLTDYHARTSGSLQLLLNRETVRELWMPRPTCEEDYYLMLSCLEAADRASVSTVLYDHGEKLTVFGNTTLCLERDMIERSQKPVLLLTLDTPSERLTLCGSSISESKLASKADAAIHDSDTVILSQQGPNLKRSICMELSDRATRLLVSNKTVAGYISPSCYPQDNVTVIIGQAEFSMKRKEA